MTAVFVHGVPETPTVWSSVRQRLDSASVALRLPGFGSSRPAELRTNEDYAGWLAEQLRNLDEPVDLIGHDWGAHLVIRVVSAYNVPVRSWFSDSAEGWHPDYEWHEGAQVIQSPQGRQFLDGMRKPNGSFGSFLVPRGIEPAVMAEIDETVDETMTDTIYDLYRDAIPNLYCYNGWGPKMVDASGTAGMIVAAEDDPYGRIELSEQTAERLSAKFVRLPGKSHYWMHQDPDAAAKLLQEFWTGR